MDEGLLHHIGDWNIEPLDMAVYELFARSPGSGLDAASESGLREKELRYRIGRLLSRKLLRTQPGGGDRFEAVPPQSASAEIAAELHTLTRRISQETETVRIEFAALETVYRTAQRKSTRSVGVETVLEDELTFEELEGFFLETRDTIFAADPAWIPGEVLANILVRRRGVNFRLIYPHTVRRNPKEFDHLNMLLDIGVQIRTAAVIPVRMVLLDQESMVTPVDPQCGRVGPILRSPLAADFANQIFEHMWELATPFTDEASHKQAFEELELAIVAELDMGHTDETIARRLGISTRTLRRHLSVLSARLGAKTRFQLGSAAVRTELLKDVLHAGWGGVAGGPGADGRGTVQVPGPTG